MLCADKAIWIQGGILYRGPRAPPPQKKIKLMEPGQRITRAAPRNMGVFLATCAIHAAVIYWISIQVVGNRAALWSALEVSFVPVEAPKDPPIPTDIPVVLTDAFAERELLDIPPPTAELSGAQEESAAIHAPPPAPPPPVDIAPEEGQGYGPLTKPQVISKPKNPQDRYPRISIRHKESGRTVLKICISATGSVDSVDVAKTSGYPRLDAAALDMALDYVFAPATRDGNPVPVCLPYGIDFRVGVGGLRRNR
jgi:periplasmic protein TonB